MRSSLRFASIVGAATLSVIAVTPAMAAAPVSQAGANAVTLSIAGNQQGTGDTTATNNGDAETKTGDATPPVSILKNQALANLGVLAQEATARGDSTSAACAGVAGQGGSVAQIGDTSCLVPGTAVNLSLGSLDLSKLVVADPASPLAPLNTVLAPILAPVTAAITQGITQARTSLGNPGIVAGFGAVEGSCTASLGSADGDATLADATISLNLPSGAPQSSIDLVNLPVNPAPNTHVTTNLSKLLTVVLSAVRTDLTTSLNGVADPLNTLTDAIQTQIVDGVVAQVEKNLAPLETNLLDITLNHQVRPTNDSIKVRALDLSVLPAAKAVTGADVLDLQIGNAACGPSGRVQSVVAAPQQQAAAPAAIPTAVSAGYATMPGSSPASNQKDDQNSIVLGAFALLVALGAGFVTVRRLRA